MSRAARVLRAFGAYSSSALVYAAVGGAAALVEWSTFAAVLRAGLAGYVQAALVAFAVATLVNYALSRRYAFVRRTSSSLGEIVRTYAVSAAALGVNLGAMVLLVESGAAAPLPAKIAGTGCGFFLNYFGRQFWVFDSAPRHRWPSWRSRRD